MGRTANHDPKPRKMCLAPGLLVIHYPPCQLVAGRLDRWFLPDDQKRVGMRKQASKGPQAHPRIQGRALRARTVRLAYRGRSGARWTYSPTVIRTGPDSVEVRMLVPLTVGLPVEIEPPPDGRVPKGGSPLPKITAQVTGCHCNADGLFRVRLALSAA